MKRLTKDERLGATMLALVALLICGLSIFFKSHSGGGEKSEKAVESIILAADSIKKAEKDSLAKKDSLKEKRRGKADRFDSRDGKRKSERRKERKEKNKEKSSSRSKKGKEPARDILSEPIPQ